MGIPITSEDEADYISSLYSYIVWNNGYLLFLSSDSFLDWATFTEKGSGE